LTFHENKLFFKSNKKAFHFAEMYKKTILEVHMYKKVFLLISLLIWMTIYTFSQTFQASQYATVPYGTYNTMDNVGDTLFLGSSEDAIYKSSNNAMNWDLVLETADGVNKISFFNASVGLAVCDDGYIYLTQDGGNSWDEIIDTSITKDLLDIYFIDENSCWIVGDGKNNQEPITILKVENLTTGPVFTVIENDFMQTSAYAITFVNNNSVGIIGCSGGVLISPDSGQTWVEPASIDLGDVEYSRSDIRAIEKVSDNILFAVGWGTFSLGFQNTIILKSIDGGMNWSNMIQTGDNATYCSAYDIEFIDDTTGYIGLGGVAHGGGLLKTVDGGINWEFMPVMSGDIKFINAVEDDIFVGGNYGNIFHSWQQRDFIPSILPRTYFSGIGSHDETIVAVGRNGYFMISEDQGETFSFGLAKAGNNLSDFQAVAINPEDQTIWATGLQGVRKYSTDLGQSWNLNGDISYSSQSGYYFMNFVNSSTVFTGGKLEANENDILLKSNDGGMNWDTLRFAAKGNAWYCMDREGDKIVVAGRKGAISLSDDNGATWDDSILVQYMQDDSLLELTKDIKGVEIVDDKIWICGFSGNCFFTDDHGQSFTKVDLGTTNSLYGIQSTHDTVMVLDINEGIYFSPDNGETWVLDSLSVELDGKAYYYGMAISGPYYYLAANYGTIIRK